MWEKRERQKKLRNKSNAREWRRYLKVFLFEMRLISSRLSSLTQFVENSKTNIKKNVSSSKNRQNQTKHIQFSFLLALPVFVGCEFFSFVRGNLTGASLFSSLFEIYIFYPFACSSSLTFVFFSHSSFWVSMLSFRHTICFFSVFFC